MCFVYPHLIHSNQNRPIACIHHVLEAVQTRESCFLVSACFPFIAGHAFHLYFVQIQILPGLLFTHHQTQNGSVVVVNLLTNSINNQNAKRSCVFDRRGYVSMPCLWDLKLQRQHPSGKDWFRDSSHQRVQSGRWKHQQ